jgi:photosystem II stability/assembly factor-like uncharacterized protein
MRQPNALGFLLVCFTMVAVHAASPVNAQVEELLPTAGPGGGRVWDLVCAPDGDLFAVSNGYIYRRARSASAWARTTEFRTTALATNTASTLFAFAYRNGLSRSEDDGQTWERLENAPETIRTLLFADVKRGFAGTSGGVFMTLDRGETWTRATDVPQVSVDALATGSAGTVYAGAKRELWRSNDGGVTWSLLSGLPNDITAIIARPEGGLYVGVAPGYGPGAEPGGMYVVDPAGVPFHAGLPWQGVAALLIHQGDVYVAGTGVCGEFVCWGPGVYRSVDGGAQWDLIGAGLTPVTSIAVGQDGALYASTSSLFTDIGGYPAAGVLRAESPYMAWQPVNDNLPHSVVYSLATSHQLVVAAADQNIFMSTDRGANWRPLATRPPHPISEQALSFELAVSFATIFALPPGGPLYVSNDLGNSWEARDAWLTGATLAQRIVLTAQGTLVMSVDDPPGLLRSTTRGHSWQHVAEFGFPHRVFDLVAGSQRRLVASAGRDFPSYGWQTYVSDDDGLTWNQIATFGGKVALAPDESTIYIAGRDATYQMREENGWALESLPHVAGVTDLEVGSDGTVYAAAERRAKRWRPGDTAWTDIAGPACDDFFIGLHWLGFEERMVIDEAGFLYLGTTCSGVMRSDVSTPIQIQEFDATTHDGAVHLSWTLAFAAQHEVAHVGVQRATQADGPFTEIASMTVLSASMSYEDRDVQPNEEYWYRLLLQSFDGRTTVAGPLRAGGGAAIDRTTLYAPIVSQGAGSVQIRYAVGPTAVPVRIAIHDVRGRLVQVLNEGLHKPGDYTRTWDRRDRTASAVARGVYIVRLKAGHVEHSRKLLLVRR